MCECVRCVYWFPFLSLFLVACYSVSDSLGWSKLGNERFRFIPILDPIHKLFEDRFMEWSVDQYRFVQWRPDGDSVLKLRHFMWVFVLMCLPLSVCIYMLLLSFHVTFCYILSVWLLVSLHETLVIVHLIFVIDMSLYHSCVGKSPLLT